MNVLFSDVATVNYYLFFLCLMVAYSYVQETWACFNCWQGWTLVINGLSSQVTSLSFKEGYFFFDFYPVDFQSSHIIRFCEISFIY